MAGGHQRCRKRNHGVVCIDLLVPSRRINRRDPHAARVLGDAPHDVPERDAAVNGSGERFDEPVGAVRDAIHHRARRIASGRNLVDENERGETVGIGEVEAAQGLGAGSGSQRCPAGVEYGGDRMSRDCRSCRCIPVAAC